jgi:hypothetical protein
MGQGLQSLMTSPSDAIGAMGGGMNVARNVAMGAAPLLMPVGNRGPSGMPEEEKDDEDLMGRYEYDPGYTGGRQVGSAFTGERMYFEPEYRRRMAQGGAVKKFADGGKTSGSSSEFDPARGMTGMSRDALLYLYGQGPTGTQESVYPDVPVIRFNPIQGPAPKSEPVRATFRSNFNDPYTSSGPVDSYGQPVFGNPAWSEYGTVSEGPSFLKRYTPTSRFDAQSRGLPFAEGGLASLAEGGFVVPADVVSMAGEGNTDAGYERIRRTLPGATPIKGRDGGQADTVKTSIEGKQPARVAHGEMYVPPETVKKAGGAKKLYAMMDKVREQATGNKKQIKPVNIKKALA